MSRYLSYSHTGMFRQANSRAGIPLVVQLEPPPVHGPVAVVGPEKEFRDYLTRGKYKGNSYIFCGGRFVLGQPQQSFLTLIFCLGPMFLYVWFVLPKSLDAPEGQDEARLQDHTLGLIQAVLSWIIFVAFFLSAFTNPGIVPRKDGKPPHEEVQYGMSDWPNPRFLRIMEITLKQKFCMTCYIYRPPRSKHCSICDNCVLRFDHHCTWLGNCIGLHNYRYFVVLIYSSSIFLMLAIYSVSHLFNKLTLRAAHGAPTGFLALLTQIFEEPILLAMFLYCLVLLLAVLLLSIYHTVISIQNLTTNEHVKNYYSDNPFNFGGTKNCWQIYCHPELVLAEGCDRIETSYQPFADYVSDFSDDDMS